MDRDIRDELAALRALCHDTPSRAAWLEICRLVQRLGFSGLKVDSCGNQRNMSEWAALSAPPARPSVCARRSTL